MPSQALLRRRTTVDGGRRAPTPAARPAPAGAVLDLQRTAGNRAVAAAIAARRGAPAPAVQRTVVDDVLDAVESVGGAALDAVAALAAVGRPTLRKGSKGDAVRTLQRLLVARGAALVVDGDYGRRTRDAVRAFQRDHDLAVDGVTGPETWRGLIRGGDAEPDAAAGDRRGPFATASPEQKADWALLGGTPAQWDAGDPPGLQPGTAFTRLTDAQKAAAVRLGYTVASWDAGREATADEAAERYAEEERRGSRRSGGTLPAKWAGSLRARTILDAEFGRIKAVEMPKVVLLTAARTKTTYEGFYGAGSYPAGGLEGFERDGTNYLNMGMQSADTVIHEMLHTQEHADWDALAYAGETSIGEGATELLTKRAATRYEIPTSTSYPAEHALVRDMNRHSSEEHMVEAYLLGGSNVTTYRTEVEAGLVAGKRWADFKARIDAGDIPGARAMLR